MYGNRYFGNRYFGDRYWGSGGTALVRGDDVPSWDGRRRERSQWGRPIRVVRENIPEPQRVVRREELEPVEALEDLSWLDWRLGDVLAPPPMPAVPDLPPAAVPDMSSVALAQIMAEAEEESDIELLLLAA